MRDTLASDKEQDEMVRRFREHLALLFNCLVSAISKVNIGPVQS